MRATGDGGNDFDLLPDAVFSLDAECRVVAANRAVTSLLGFRSEDLVGHGAAEVLRCRMPDGKPLLVDGWPRAAGLRSVRAMPEHKVVMRAADGSDVLTLVTGASPHGQGTATALAQVDKAAVAPSFEPRPNLARPAWPAR